MNGRDRQARLHQGLTQDRLREWRAAGRDDDDDGDVGDSPKRAGADHARAASAAGVGENIAGQES